jgi:hypothetical protein
MSLSNYKLTRNVDARKEGSLKTIKVAFASITHENGEEQHIVIPEDEIRLHGGSHYIDKKVMEAAAKGGLPIQPAKLN